MLDTTHIEKTLTVDTVQMGRAREVRPSRLLGAALMILAGLLSGCGQPGGTRTTPSPSSSPTPTATRAPVSGGPCGTTSTPPRQYLHVIWIIMENKSYSSVIGSSSAPYETQLAHQCASDTHWSDAGSQYNSLPSYIAMTTGQSGFIPNNNTIQPSTTPGGVPLFQTFGTLVGTAQAPFGVVLANQDAGKVLRVYSSEVSDVAKRPTLSVTYQ